MRHLLKLSALFTLVSLTTSSFADNTQIQASPENYLFRMDYLSVGMPNGQSDLGLTGLHAIKQFDPGFYTGFGLYSSVSGQYNGFFGLGGEAGWKHLIYHQLGLDTGIFLGTGGGKNSASQIGNGSFVLPHIGLYYHFPKFNVGLNYSKIRFQGGKVNSQQAELMLEWPFQLFTRTGSNLIGSDEPLHFDWSKNYLAAAGTIYHPEHSKFGDGTNLTNNTELLGVELGHFFTKNFYSYFQFSGAVHGNPNGYANLFTGLGWQQQISQSPFFYTARFALGSGGGGNYDTGGGLLVYPELGLGWQFAEHWSATVLPGYVSSFGGHYHAISSELQLRHDFDIATPGDRYTQNASAFDTQNWRVRFGNQLYIKPEHDTNAANDNINLFALKIDKFIVPNIYATGQTAFAYTGNAAGYFSGMLGAGYQTNAYHNASLFGEALVGTAGGAGLDIHDGALWQAGAGLNYQWTPAFGSYGELSKTVAFRGSFHPTTVDLGLSYSFGLLK